MDTSNQIPEYVFAYLRGEAGEQQADEAKKWIAVGNNAETFRLLDKAWKLSGDLRLFSKFRVEEGRRAVAWKIRLNKILRIKAELQKAAAILFIPVLITAFWFVWQNRNLKNEFAPVPVVQEIKAQPGVKTHFFLPDSSEVWLNSASAIRFPNVFAQAGRMVELEGEAYIKVAKDKARPFTVKAGSLNVVALGTAFNICAYPGDNKISATLEEGKVEITNNLVGGKGYMLSPGEQIDYYSDSRKSYTSRVKVGDVIAWKEGKLVFNEAPFSEVVTRLGRWFNADIQLDGSTLGRYHYTATFTDENLIQVLELLKLTAPIDYSSKSREILDNNGFSKQEVKIWGKPDAKINMNQIK